VPRKHKYEQVRDVLRKRISDYPPGLKISSIAKLHKELSVSTQTINRAISDLVDEGILERQSRRGTFVSRPEKSRIIGFIWPETIRRLTRHPYMAAILHGAQMKARSGDRHLLVASYTDGTHPAFLDGKPQVAGLLILFNNDVQLVKAYIDRGVPVVLIDPFVRERGVPFVTSDDCLGSHEATMHLVNLGHRRIVHVTVDLSNCIPLESRIRGYKDAMLEAGLGGMTYVHRGPFERWDEAGGEAFLDMLRSVQPTACCCFNDDVAAGVARVCHEGRIGIPDELSIVGYDDSGIAGETWPPITTVRVPLEELGHTAMRLLDQLIEEDHLTGPGILLPTQIIERASTKAPSTRGLQTPCVEEDTAGRY